MKILDGNDQKDAGYLTESKRKLIKETQEGLDKRAEIVHSFPFYGTRWFLTLFPLLHLFIPQILLSTHLDAFIAVKQADYTLPLKELILCLVFYVNFSFFFVPMRCHSAGL